MRVINWNIRQGGGSGVPQIGRHIADVAADLVILTEFRTRNESALRAALNDVGLPFVVTSDPAPKNNGLLVASRWALADPEVPSPDADSQRWLALRIAELDLDILAVHIPGAPDHSFEQGYGVSGAKRKELMWECVLAYAAAHHGQRAMVVGDFNTGLRVDAEGAMFKQSGFMQRLIDSGFTDSWRHQHPQGRDYTFYTRRKDKQSGNSADLNGFRIDHLFVSPTLRHAVVAADILHDPRKAGTSDHASLVVEIDLDASATPPRPSSPAIANASDRRLESAPTDDVARVAGQHRGPGSLREEILALLRRADCHYGNTLRDEEAGSSVERAARERNVRTDRIVELRAAVHRVADGEYSRTKSAAGHEDGILRALLHFRNEMSEDLSRHIATRLSRLKAEFIPALKVVPLQCNSRGANRPQRAPTRERSCVCGYAHAGECP